MTDVTVRSSTIFRGFFLRFAIGIAVVLLLIALSFGGNLGAALRYFASAPGHLHAPDLSLVARAPLAIQLHLSAALTAFAIGVAQLIGVKGTTAHRVLGWTWVIAIGTAAISSLFIREVNHGQFSFIHLLSGWTIIVLPMAVYAARRHRVARHGQMMAGLFVGGLIIAGVLAFLPGRLMWQMFFG